MTVRRFPNPWRCTCTTNHRCPLHPTTNFWLPDNSNDVIHLPPMPPAWPRLRRQSPSATYTG